MSIQSALNTIVCDDFLVATDRWDRNSIALIVTDPPWGANAWQKGEYTDDELYIKAFIPKWLTWMHDLLKPSCHIYLFVPTKYLENWLIPFKATFDFHNILIALNMKTGRRYANRFRNNYQMILFGSKGKPRDFNQVDWILTSDSWFTDKRNKTPHRYTYDYPSYLPPYIKATVEEHSGEHPDEKNYDLVKNLILISSNPHELVADFFCGSGVVPCAAKATGRQFIGIDINPAYCQESRVRCGLETPEKRAVTPPEIPKKEVENPEDIIF